MRVFLFTGPMDLKIGPPGVPVRPDGCKISVADIRTFARFSVPNGPEKVDPGEIRTFDLSRSHLEDRGPRDAPRQWQRTWGSDPRQV